MDGSKPPINNSPLGAPQKPVTPASPDSNGGIQPRTGQRFIPDSSSIPQKPIGARPASAQQNVQPQLNIHGQTRKHSDAYLEHHAQATAIESELTLADSVPAIRHLLENPAEAKKSSRFIILWVPDDGSDAVRVIPPDEKMRMQKELAAELRKTLGNQLTRLESRFVPSKIQDLQVKCQEELVLRDHAAAELGKLGAPLPELPEPTNVTVFGASHISTPVAYPAEITPETKPPTTTNPQEAEPTAPAGTPAKNNGQFMFQLTPPVPSHESDLPQNTRISGIPEPTLEAEAEEGNQRELLTEKPVRSPFFSSSRSFDERVNERVNERLPTPPSNDFTSAEREIVRASQTGGQVRFPPDQVIRSSISPRSRPEESQPTPLSNAFAPPPTPFSAQSGAAYSVLGIGRDGVHSDLYRSSGQPSSGAIASVNAGNEQLSVDGKGINRQFRKEMAARGDQTDYQRLHQSMWSHCVPDNYHVATPEDLQYAPGLKTSLIYRPSDARGRTGTVIINVFKEPYPNGNPANRAMIYVVPPDGNSGISDNDFKREVAQTAKDIVHTLHIYNRYTENHPELPTISDLRVCGFGSSQYRHPNVPEKVVGQCIDQGTRKAAEYIQTNDQYSLSVKNIEYANGSSGVFSHLNTSVLTEEPLDFFGSTPFVSVPPVPSPPLQNSRVANRLSVDDLLQMDDPQRTSTPNHQLPEPDTSWSHFNEPPPYPAPALSPVENTEPVSNPPPVTGHYTRSFLEPLTPEPTATPAPQSYFSTALNNSPVPLASDVENKKNQYALWALAKARGPIPAPDEPRLTARLDSRLHTVRKAQIARVLLNFHRGRSTGTPGSDAAQIPNQALPLIEMGILCSKSSRPELLAGQSSTQNADTARMHLKSLNMGNDLARVLAETIHGTVSRKNNVLAMVMRDVERMESMRTVEQFDIASLESFQMYGEEGKQELIKLCIEYKDMLSSQGELSGAVSTTALESKYTSNRRTEP